MGVVPTPLATLPTPLIDMAAEIEQMLSACKCPILVSGSNGSGKVDVFKHLAASRGLGLQQVRAYLVSVPLRWRHVQRYPGGQAQGFVDLDLGTQLNLLV